MTGRWIVIFLTGLMYPLVGQTGAVLSGSQAVCGLLSRLEVEEATGIPVQDGVPRLRSAALGSCLFDGKRPGQVTILVRRYTTADWISEQVGRMSLGVQLGTYHEVPGIGDRAFFYRKRSAGGVLCIFNADYYLQVSLYRPGEDSQIVTTLEKLARGALATLNGQRSGSAGPRHAIR